MTKDNASGAGMRLQQRLKTASQMSDDVSYLTVNATDLKAVLDATRLLAESQAHNAKLEAQVERLREALEQLIACHDEPSCPALDVARAALKP
jgi:hypothetical protein